MIDARLQFIDAIRVTGLNPPDIIVPGRFHRFPGVGKCSANTAGWCILFEDELGGFFGDFSTDLSNNWQAKREQSYSDSEIAMFKKNISHTRKKAQKEIEAKYAAAAIRAEKIWNIATPLEDNHPYIVRKYLDDFSLCLNNDKVVKQHNNNIVLPIHDFSGNLTSLQFIKPDGSKRLLAGGRKRDCIIHIQNDLITSPRYFPHQVIICEGWATGYTLACKHPYALVLAAIDVGNIESVASLVRDEWNDITLIIAGDDDRLTPGNPGATKARAAAFSSDAFLTLPQWPIDAPNTLTDFNDLHIWHSQPHCKEVS